MTWIQLAYFALAACIAFASQYTEGAVQHAMLAVPAFMLGQLSKQIGTEGRKVLGGKRPSIPPVALVFAAMLALPACGAWSTLKPIIRTIADIALASCHAHAAANPKMLGPLTAEQWCDQADNFTPFLEAQRMASVQASQALGLQAAPPLAGEVE